MKTSFTTSNNPPSCDDMCLKVFFFKLFATMLKRYF